MVLVDWVRLDALELCNCLGFEMGIRGNEVFFLTEFGLCARCLSFTWLVH